MRHTPAAPLLALALAACSGRGYDLPERTEEVRAIEAQLAAELSRSRELWQEDGTCKVRLLGTEGAARYAWADCSYPNGGGLSIAVRVENGTVTMPADGGGHADSVRKIFPDGLEERILDHDDELRP